jgi:hypothetical protein
VTATHCQRICRQVCVFNVCDQFKQNAGIAVNR